jgi:hypothetical protein
MDLIILIAFCDDLLTSTQKIRSLFEISFSGTRKDLFGFIIQTYRWRQMQMHTEIHIARQMSVVTVAMTINKNRIVSLLIPEPSLTEFEVPLIESL